eukprot:gene6179-8510_t
MGGGIASHVISTHQSSDVFSKSIHELLHLQSKQTIDPSDDSNKILESRLYYISYCIHDTHPDAVEILADELWNDWIESYVDINHGQLMVINKDSHEIITQVSLVKQSIIKCYNGSTVTTQFNSISQSIDLMQQNNISRNELFNGEYTIEVDDGNIGIRIRTKDPTTDGKLLRNEIMFHSSAMKTNPLVGLQMLCQQFEELYTNETEVSFNELELRQPRLDLRSGLTIPKMNICILVVGTRGDVQPFIYLGQSLKKDGHRVRLATHAEYRDDVVAKGGLEYYPLAGDPRKLSEYMVKTEGRLIPDLLSREERTQLPEKMKMLEEITFSCFPACTAPDPEDTENTPFLADAIISNPVSYGHIHVAEAICVPLHIMFPQPWSPTKCFPHPLSNMGFQSNWSLKNFYSYKVVDEMMWMGLGWIINRFRVSMNLQPIHIGERGDAILNRNKVPISHMWSPSFVPKCVDWQDHVDVVGEFRPSSDSKNSFVPPLQLVEFLEAGDKPIYIGFGSMVIDDVSRLLATIKEAVQVVGCRILLQSGWTKYAEDFELIAPGVMVIGAMPHDYLLYQVCGVIHHGGAGTTSAGLRAGNPTFICPFFGDQHFWAEMVNRAGAGPPGCPISKLTTSILISAFQQLLLDDTKQNVAELSKKMLAEDGVEKGKASFYRNLPIGNMVCEVSIFNNKAVNLARVYCQSCDLKMSLEVDEIVHRKSELYNDHIRIPFRPSRWGIVPPKTVVDGLQQGLGVAMAEFAGGVWDLFAKPIEGGMNNGIKGIACGMAVGMKNVVTRPVKGGKEMVGRVYTSLSSHKESGSAAIEHSLRKTGSIGGLTTTDSLTNLISDACNLSVKKDAHSPKESLTPREPRSSSTPRLRSPNTTHEHLMAVANGNGTNSPRSSSTPKLGELRDGTQWNPHNHNSDRIKSPNSANESPRGTMTSESFRVSTRSKMIMKAEAKIEE